ncbi:MAG: helix-turn-helix domain-containing protein [Gammaproteobacteria bacterium]
MSDKVALVTGASRGIGAESAVALEDSRICEWPVDALKSLCRDQPSIQEEVFKLMGKTIRLDQEKLLLLGSRSAEARIAGFLLDMALRMEERGLSGREFILPMARGDIANYLGLAHETVSRLFGKLVEDQLIEADRRHITIVDRKGMENLAMDENSTPHRS